MKLRGLVGLKIHAGDGWEELGFPEIMSTPLFYYAHKGDRLTLTDRRYKFNAATYSATRDTARTAEIEDKWVHVYDYAPNEAWVVYRNDLTGESYRQEEYVFDSDVYFRVCLRKVDGALFVGNKDIFGGNEDIDDILSFNGIGERVQEDKPWLNDEVRRVTDKVNAFKRDGELTFALLTDSHYVVNGTWNDTVESIRQTHDKLEFDGIIHLGDLTDGMLTGEVTKHYTRRVLDDLRGVGAPVWLALGNHDSNYFKNNPERFTAGEQRDIYFNGGSPRHVVDFGEHKLRLIFLDSFDFEEEKNRYGYSDECVNWLKEQLAVVDSGWKVIVFSHVSPMARLQYWAKEIRGEHELMNVLRDNKDKVLAFINGHNHADRLDNEEGFPIMSIANSKCEDFTEYKTAGFVTPKRALNDRTQECWDIVTVNAEEGRVRFTRFGAGDDRIIENGRVEWL